MNDVSEKTASSKSTWKNLGVRALSAVILVGICFSPFYFGGALWAALVALLGSRLVWEWVRMADPAPHWLSYALPIFGLLAALTYIYSGMILACAIIIVTTAVLTVLERSRREGGLWAGFGFLYVAVPCALIVLLRGNESGFAAQGFLLVTFLIIVVGAADTGAYFGGSYFKGPKMAPKLSPKKTWSGFVSGYIAGSLFGAAFALITGFSPITGALIAGPVIIFSVIGDFLESGLKRRLEVKDTGELLPGHGGLLDRVDSLMMVVFVATIALAVWPGLWPL
ncbi:MAG: phosphatidate cytidylyltransferase [Alphaproteobacteria bacterium]